MRYMHLWLVESQKHSVAINRREHINPAPLLECGPSFCSLTLDSGIDLGSPAVLVVDIVLSRCYLGVQPSAFLLLLKSGIPQIGVRWVIRSSWPTRWIDDNWPLAFWIASQLPLHPTAPRSRGWCRALAHAHPLSHNPTSLTSSESSSSFPLTLATMVV